MTTPVLLDVQDLCVDYLGPQQNARACNNVTFTLRRSEILGVAGESASGKSTLLTAIMRLQKAPAMIADGSIMYHRSDGTIIDLAKAPESRIRPLRWVDLSIVMQSAMACLNPVMRLSKQFTDVLAVHEPHMSAKQRMDRAVELLDMVGIDPRVITKYPHELSGGMRQRSLIALAMACNPELIVMDEPTTAVDVVMQRQILDQILTLQATLGFAIIFVTHDLSLLLEIADRIAIMYAGRLIEIGDGEDMAEDPIHPYSIGLRAAFPSLLEEKRLIHSIPGSPPNLLDLPPGCPFEPRCEFATDACSKAVPPLTELLGNRMVACPIKVAERDSR